jgi:cytochrome c biogenesis factor
MNEWYSGLIPYPILLPLQIVLLMVMSAVVMREVHAGPRASGRSWVRRIAIVYFAVMLLRLVVQLLRGADNVIDAGGIPVAFHWVLALFLLVLARRNSTMGRLACPPAQKAEVA